MRAIHPASDPDCRCVHVAIGDAQQRKAGKAVIKDNVDLLLDPFAGKPTQDMARAAAVYVLHVLAALVEKRETIDALAIRKPERLAGFEIRERIEDAASPRDHATAQL